MEFFTVNGLCHESQILILRNVAFVMWGYLVWKVKCGIQLRTKNVQTEEILIESIALRAIWWIRVRVHLFFNLDLNGQMCDGFKSRWDMNSCLFMFSCFCPSFFLMSSHRLIDYVHGRIPCCYLSYTKRLQETAPLFLKYFLAMSRWKSQIYHQFLLS